MTGPVQSQQPSRYTMSGGRPVDQIHLRFCPKDSGHWLVGNERCPVCKSKIQTAIYSLTTVEGGERTPAASTGKRP